MEHSQSLKHNEDAWNEFAKAHSTKKSALYDVPEFIKDPTLSTLLPAEETELSPHLHKGTSMLHLMCHIGLDSISWARKGAAVVGVDFSEEAILAATKIAEETGLKDRAKFVRSNVYEARKNLGTQEFDIVFTSYGVLCWLPDLTKWAKVISSCLKPGGIFYIVESHPFVQSLEQLSSKDTKEDESKQQKVELIVKHDYFSKEPMQEVTDWTYAGLQVDKTCKMFEWQHSIGEIINVLVDSGLTVTFVHEFPWDCFKRFPSMVQKEPRGPWFLPEGVPQIPMTFSLMAKKHL